MSGKNDQNAKNGADREELAIDVEDLEDLDDIKDPDDPDDAEEGARRAGRRGKRRSRTRWVGPRKRWVPIAVLVVVAIGSAALTWLLTTIFEHKQEAKSPFTQVVQLTDTTYDPAVWGQNFPIQYEQYKKTREDTDGDFVEVEPTDDDPRDYHTTSRIDMETRAQRMWRGYAFAIDYTEPRGHEWALEDQKNTKRNKPPSSSPAPA